MASFESANLSHELSGGFVVFKVDAKIRFEPHELGHQWLFQIELMEEDVVSDDKLYVKRHYFVPSEGEVDFSISEEVAKHKVDTEWGKEEVYANLQAIPLKNPPGFVAGQTRTNTTIVDV